MRTQHLINDPFHRRQQTRKFHADPLRNDIRRRREFQARPLCLENDFRNAVDQRFQLALHPAFPLFVFRVRKSRHVQVQFFDLFEMKAERCQQGFGVTAPRNQAFRDAVAVPQKTGIGGVMDVAFGDGGVSTNMLNVDVAFLLHLKAEELVAGFPGLGLDGMKGLAKEGMVDGLLFEEPTKVLKEHGIGDANGGFTVVPTFGLHEKEGTDEVFGGEIGFTFFDGRLGEFGEIVVKELEDVGHGQEKLVDPVVPIVIFVYNFGRLVVFGLPENRKNGVCYFTHRYLLGLSVTNNHDTNAFFCRN